MILPEKITSIISPSLTRPEHTPIIPECRCTVIHISHQTIICGLDLGKHKNLIYRASKL